MLCRIVNTYMSGPSLYIQLALTRVHVRWWVRAVNVERLLVLASHAAPVADDFVAELHDGPAAPRRNEVVRRRHVAP
jgi:hypothetical protein